MQRRAFGRKPLKFRDLVAWTLEQPWRGNEAEGVQGVTPPCILQKKGFSARFHGSRIALMPLKMGTRNTLRAKKQVRKGTQERAKQCKSMVASQEAAGTTVTSESLDAIETFIAEVRKHCFGRKEI